MGKKRAILWFRQDLRLHDNEALSEALRSADEIIPLYIFDDRIFKARTTYGFPKIGSHRIKFIIESIHDLRNSLRELNSELYIRSGVTEDIIYKLAREYKTSFTFCNRERTQEEVNVQDALERQLWSIGQEVKYTRGKMLYYTADLPFPVNHTPDQYSVFKKETERIIPIRNLIPLDSQIQQKTIFGLEPGELPKLSDFKPSENGIMSSPNLSGGEMNGLNWLHKYLWAQEKLKNPDRNNSKKNREVKSMLSPFLSQGCLSPKKVYHELRKYEEQNTVSELTNQLFQHLIYRDYLRLMAKKHGNNIFLYNGIRGQNSMTRNNDSEKFSKWAKAKTGDEFIDASMTQLNKTGFLSYQNRQMVAFYLINELGVNWKMGAEYFESLLIDYDPCSNWVNWNIAANVGPESKERIIKSQNAAQRLDPKREYISQWLNVKS